MKCEQCGKDLIKVGILNEEETENYFFSNEKINCAYQALNMDVLKNMQFSDGQVFEYFRAAYDALASAKFLQYILNRDIKSRRNITEDIIIDPETLEIYIHQKD